MKINKYVDDALLCIAFVFFICAGYTISDALALYTAGIECMILAFLLARGGKH